MQYYLHNFLTSQPDLNFHCPAVQEALLDTARFWLDRGVDGFRLDTINFYFADKLLRDNPALPAERRNDKIAPAVNPYNWQDHIHSKNQPENIEFLRKFRTVMEPYGAAAVGEVGDALRGLEIMGQYTSGDDLMQMCYAFEFLAKDKLTAARVAEIFARLDAGGARRLGLLGLFQPRRRSPRQQMASFRFCSKGLCDAPHVPQGLRLPLSGRGAWPDRGGTGLRGSA